MKVTRAMTRLMHELMCSGALVWGEEGRWSDMARKIEPGGRNLPSDSTENGHEHERGDMNARQNDVLEDMAGRAHKDADPVAKKSADRLGVTPRTARRYANSGPPQVRHAQTYLFDCPNPYPVLAMLKATAKAGLLKKTKADLIARFHALRDREKEVEGEDNRLDVQQGVKWLDRAHKKAQDAAVNEELSAICKLFAMKGVTDEEVWR